MIILVNPRREHNVFQAARAALAYGVPEVVYVGSEPLPSPGMCLADPGHVNIRRDDGIWDHLEGYSLVSMEITSDALPLPMFRHPEKACYIFGPEDGFIWPWVMAASHFSVSIPTTVALNLGMAVGTVLYDRAAKEFHRA